MPYPNFAAGMVPTADELAALQQRYVIQGSDAPATTTTFVSSDLSFIAEANAEYRVVLEVAYGAHGDNDVKFDWLLPSGAEMNRYLTALAPSMTATASDPSNQVGSVKMRRPNPTTAVGAGSADAAAFHYYSESGRIKTGGSGGACTFRFAKNSNTATTTDTVLRANSLLWYIRVG